MNQTLHEAMLKALYAGYRYQLATDECIEASLSGAAPPTTTVRHMNRYNQEWRKWTQLAIELHQQGAEREVTTGNPE